MQRQIYFFEGGGFVVHKIALTEKTHASAWYDKEGNLVDSEVFRTSDRQARGAVKPGTASHERLEKIGILYREMEGKVL